VGHSFLNRRCSTEAMSNLLKRNKDTMPSAKLSKRREREGPTAQAHATLCRVAAVSLAQLLRPMAASGVPQPPAERVAAVTAALRRLPCLAQQDKRPSAEEEVEVDVDEELRRSVAVLQLTDRAAALAAHASTSEGGGGELCATGQEAEAEAEQEEEEEEEEHEEDAVEVRARSDR
jgi:hypothetical protein